MNSNTNTAFAQEYSITPQIQQSLNFGINDHFYNVHNKHEHTAIVWQAQRQAGAWSKLNPSDDIANILADMRGKKDCYFSVNEFDRWRRVSLLKGLNALYVDIDGMSDLNVALEACDDAILPRPSLAVESGRGIHLYWLIEKADRSQLGLWQRVQNHIIQALAEIGADPAARDCTRLLRLTNTVNSKSSTQVKGFVIDQYRWNLNEIANEIISDSLLVMPAARPTRAKAVVRDIRAKQRSTNKRVSGSIYQRWHRVYEDLITLAEYHNGVPEGFRNNWVFLSSNALSWFTHAEGVENEIKANIKQYTDLDEAQALTAMQSVLNRASDASQGKTIQHNGKDVDPRYRFKRETLFEWCSDYIDEGIEDQLKAIISDDTAEQRKTERNRGRYKREKEAMRCDGMDLLAKGHKTAVVAEKMGVSLRTVQNWKKIMVSSTYKKSAETEPCIAPPHAVAGSSGR